ncbi:MAG: hypothetical protein WC712_04595 [Candidatus Brocadiia bacterium]
MVKMVTPKSLLIFLALTLLLCEAGAGEVPPPFPDQPRDIVSLLDALESPRMDIRTHALDLLLDGPPVDAALLTGRLTTAHTAARIALYSVAAKWGDESTLAVMLDRYPTLKPTSFEAIRMMENILAMGVRYRLPPDFLPSLLRAWLEGDEDFTDNAALALEKMGRGALPELLRLMKWGDEGQIFTVMTLMSEMGVVPERETRAIAMSDFSSADVALDAAVMWLPNGLELAGQLLKNEDSPESVRRRALWWLVASGLAPKAEELIALAKGDSDGLAADGRFALYCTAFPDWMAREKTLREGARELTARDAYLLLYCGDRESILTLALAHGDKEADKLREPFFKRVLGSEDPPGNIAFREIPRLFPTMDSLIASRLRDLAGPLAKGGKYEQAAQLLSRSLMLAWDNQSSAELMEIMAGEPGIESALFLAPWRKWNCSGEIGERAESFARAVSGSLADAYHLGLAPEEIPQERLDPAIMAERIAF